MPLKAAIIECMKAGYRFWTKERSGVSLLISLILVGILVIFGLTISNIVISSIRESANVNRANQAFYAAEGALEKGLLENLQHGAGYTSNVETVGYGQFGMCTDPANCSSCCSTKYPNDLSLCVSACMSGNSGSPLKATYKIQGQVPVSSQYASSQYGIPTPGSGDVGKNCDPLTAVKSGSFYWPEGSQTVYSDPTDHPCNWNKIRVGETVAIPLYYTDSNGDPVNLMTPNSTFQLKIRTACSDGSEFCAPLDRYDLNYLQGDATYNGNDPIVSWQIVGEDSNAGGTTLTLGPYIYFLWNNDLGPLATIIHEKKINNTASYIVLNTDSFGEDPDKCRGEIRYFLTNNASAVDGGGGLLGCSSTLKWDTQQIVKPVLKFTVIHSLKDILNNDIPYLEYQLLSSSNMSSQPSNVSQTVTAEGFSGSFKQVLEVKQPQESGLLEYVIQQ